MRLVLLTIVFLSLILGIRYAFFFESRKEYVSQDAFKEKITLLSEPKTSEFSQTFRIGKVVVQAPIYPEFHYGDTLLINGRVEESEFQAKDGRKVTSLRVRNPTIEKKESNNPFIVSASLARSRVSTAFLKFLPHDYASLLFGIVFGSSQGINASEYDKYRNVGLLHVIAASGMNVSLVAGFLFSIFGRLVSRRKAITISILGVFYYALISGFSASIMRAAIMSSFAFTAQIVGRNNTGVLTLVLTVFIMLFASPGLVFDIGFWLSVTSTLGILLVKPILDSIKIIDKVQSLVSDLTTTVSAQIGSIPVMIYAFGSYSAISIITNALVLWTVPPLMVIGGIAALLALFSPDLSAPLLYLAYPFLMYFVAIVNWFGDWEVISVGNFPILIFAGYYLLLGSIILGWKKRKEK